MNLLDVYNRQKEAEVQEKQASAEENGQKEVLRKYASAAEGALREEYGDDFTAEDVEKLASMMIEHDVQQEVMEEKVAEYAQAGTIMAKAFKDELER